MFIPRCAAGRENSFGALSFSFQHHAASSSSPFLIYNYSEMSSDTSKILFACSQCLKRHPFEDLSTGQQLCKECRGSILKCVYCRTEFSQSKGTTSAVCKKCENNIKNYGRPKTCELCCCVAAFIGSKCQRCSNSEKKYGPPVTCEQCKQKCAFERDDEKVEGRVLCWLCTLSLKRSLKKFESKEKRRHKTVDKRPLRPDVTKAPVDEPKQKAPKVPNLFNPNEWNVDTDVVGVQTVLREQIANLERQLAAKDQLILNKEKEITSLRATEMLHAQEHREKIRNIEREHSTKIDSFQMKIKDLQREVAVLKKSVKSREPPPPQPPPPQPPARRSSSSGSDSSSD